MRPPSIEVRGIRKRFGGVRALDGVDLRVEPGEFHALVGENGAGKSTLAKCMLGINAIDEGNMLVDGTLWSAGDPRLARQHGIGMVFQHFTLIPSMTIAENLSLPRPGLPAIIRWKEERERLRAFFANAPFQVDLDARISELSAGQKQKVEILKELYLGTKFLMLDEPTSVLTPDEAEEVLIRLRAMVNRGDLSVLLITHKFREVMKYADRVTVLRKGRTAGARSVSATCPEELAGMMMGETRTIEVVERDAKVGGPVVFAVAGLRTRGDKGVDVLHDLSLEVRAGEILGVAGISGNGQRELVEVIAGQRPYHQGRISVNGERYVPERECMQRLGIYVLPEVPLRNAAVPGMTVAENIALRQFDRPPFTHNGLLSYAAIRRAGAELINRFSVSPPSPDLPIETLSGGNVQRAILARELGGQEIRVLVAANPCFGLDFGAAAFIHNRLVDARNRGAAVLLISEDLDELLDLADRIVVMSAGRIVHESIRSQADQVEIGRHMAGHAAG
ncbi:MAG: ABC transporter ATP-binding protein [Acidobacteria bacterium]|nr:ABC transporter ATP-binding protein [Acidobacteriota bacterium]